MHRMSTAHTTTTTIMIMVVARCVLRERVDPDVLGKVGVLGAPRFGGNVDVGAGSTFCRAVPPELLADADAGFGTTWNDGETENG